MAARGLKPNTKTVAMLAVITALLFIGGVAIYLVSAEKLREATADYQSRLHAVEDSKKISLRLSQAEVDYRTTQEQLATLEKAISKRAYIPTLLKQIEELGHETHLQVISVRPEVVAETPQPKPVEGDEEQKVAKSAKPEPPKPYHTQPISVEVSGNYWNVTSFLYQITTFPKILAVDSLNAEPSSASITVGSPKLMVKLKLTAFVFEESAPEPAKVSEPGTAAVPAAKESQENKA